MRSSGAVALTSSSDGRGSGGTTGFARACGDWEVAAVVGASVVSEKFIAPSRPLATQDGSRHAL
jgi:hypothetical protein